MIDGEWHAQIEPVEQTGRRRADTVDTSGVALLTRLAAYHGAAGHFRQQSVSPSGYRNLHPSSSPRLVVGTVRSPLAN